MLKVLEHVEAGNPARGSLLESARRITTSSLVVMRMVEQDGLQEATDVCDGCLDKQRLLRNEDLVEERRGFRARIKGRPKLGDGERGTPAEIAKNPGHRLLEEVAAIVGPDTLLPWHRKLVARKFDGSRKRRHGHKMCFTGNLVIDRAGEYIFHVDSADRARPWVDGEVLVGPHGGALGLVPTDMKEPG